MAPPAPELPPFLQNPTSQSDASVVTVPARRWRGFIPGLAVGIAASLATVMVTGVGEPKPAERSWLDVVANYQRLYVPETLSTPYNPRGQSVSAQNDNIQQLSQLVNLDLSRIKNIEGMTFKRAQQLGFNGKPLVQMVFALPDGTPVAICILQSDANSRGPRSQTLEGMAASDWTTGTHGVLIIGGEDQNLINQITPQVQSLI